MDHVKAFIRLQTNERREPLGLVSPAQNIFAECILVSLRHSVYGMVASERNGGLSNISTRPWRK